MFWNQVLPLGPLALPYFLLPLLGGALVLFLFLLKTPKSIRKAFWDISSTALFFGYLGTRLILLISLGAALFSSPLLLLMSPGALWAWIAFSLGGVIWGSWKQGELPWKAHGKYLLLALGSATSLVALVFLLGNLLQTEETRPSLPPLAYLEPGENGEFFNPDQDPRPLLILNFWASWCTPCIVEIPELNSFWTNERQEGILLLGVNSFHTERGGLEGVRLFSQEQNIQFPVVLDQQGVWSERLNIQVLPTTLVFSPEGKLLERKTGIVTQDILQNWVNRYAP